MSVLNNIAKCSCGFACLKNVGKSQNLVFVRFRKPRWVPKAPSKIYQVREPTPIDPEEYQKMLEWTRHYNTARKSLRSYLYQYNEATEMRRKIEAAERPFAERYQEMVEANNIWNTATGQIKNEELLVKSDMEALKRQKMEERQAQEVELMKQAATARVQLEQEASSTFISPENLEEEVEKMLNTRVDYDYALLPDGSTSSDPKQPIKQTLPPDS